MNFATMFNKVIGRVERDVAVAGAMVGSVSAMSKLFPALERLRTLRLDFYGSPGYQMWDCWRDDGADPTDAFQDFLRWYHGRPQSECYVMRHKQGCNMVKRCDIRSYSITKGERKKERSDDIHGEGK